MLDGHAVQVLIENQVYELGLAKTLIPLELGCDVAACSDEMLTRRCARFIMEAGRSDYRDLGCPDRGEGH